MVKLHVHHSACLTHVCIEALQVVAFFFCPAFTYCDLVPLLKCRYFFFLANFSDIRWPDIEATGKAPWCRVLRNVRSAVVTGLCIHIAVINLRTRTFLPWSVDHLSQGLIGKSRMKTWTGDEFPISWNAAE